MKEKLTAPLLVRLTPSQKKEFTKKAESYGDPSTILRELISAFVDDRLTMTPPKDHPLYGEDK